MGLFKSSEIKLQMKKVVISFSADASLMILNKRVIFFLTVTQIFSDYSFIF